MVVRMWDLYNADTGEALKSSEGVRARVSDAELRIIEHYMPECLMNVMAIPEDVEVSDNATN